jgi:hypothetical protein
MRRRLCQLLSLLIAVVLPATPLIAESPTAVVHTRGSVTINGKTPGESSNLFNGDRIQTTGPDSAASIVVNGMHVMVMGNTTVTYGENNLSDLCGGVLISTKGIAEQINGISVIPAPTNGSARYEFRQSQGSYLVFAREGSVAYGSEAKIVAVNQSARSAGGGEGCKVEPAAAEANAAPAGTNPAPVEGGISAGGGGLSNGVLWALGGASAFAAVCAVECRGHHHNKSPKNP